MRQPPFCPNRLCDQHREPNKPAWWRKNGFHLTQTFGKVQRYQCLSCGATFSTQTFSVHFYAKRFVNLRALERRLASSMSIRSLSRDLGRSCGTILNRIDRLARQGIAMHAQLRPLRRMDEPVCFDGLVSFDRSQYLPNDVGISITASSRYALGLSHATTRRSGRMTPAQKVKRARIDTAASFEPGPLERSFFSHLDMLLAEQRQARDRPLVLVTDKKLEYVRALRAHPLYRGRDEAHPLVHSRVSSTLPRTASNPLFASNYYDREVRKDLAQHRRETACFARNPANGMARMLAHLVYHNYEKPHLVNGKTISSTTSAEVAGIARSLISRLRKAMFSRRFFLSHLELKGIDRALWEKEVYDPLKEGLSWAYRPLFACA